MRIYVFGPYVGEDLDIIWEYIAANNLAADRMIAKLFDVL